MIVLLNPAAGGGRAAARWRRVAPALAARLGAFETRVLEPGVSAERLVAGAWEAGHRLFLAAGGDGTVHAVVNALMSAVPAPRRAEIALGAVGLGSSNDFHKPFRTRVEGVPCRIGFAGAAPRDVGVCSFVAEEGERHLRYWMINASVGATADANRRFNAPGATLRALKRASTPAAILYAAAGTLLGARARQLEIAVDGGPAAPLLTQNLGVVKSPHFSGSLRYDSPLEPASGDFFVHHLGDVSRARLLATFAALARGRFAGLPGARSFRARGLAVRDSGPFAVELDGEVVTAVAASFSLVPAGLAVCR